MTTFALVHGGWMGAWCWERLTPLLQQEGHAVVAMDLPCDDGSASFDTYADAVCAALKGCDRSEQLSLTTSVGCNPILTTAHPWDGTFTIQAGMSTNQVSASFELNSSNQPLSGVLTTPTGLFGFVPGKYGDAQVSASGSSVTEATVTGTYQITGHVLPVTVVNSWTGAQAPKPGASASSFEFDGTCQ